MVKLIIVYLLLVHAALSFTKDKQLSAIRPINAASQQKDSEKAKLAFLFLTRGPMQHEPVWRLFFSWRATSAHYSIYIHPGDRHLVYPNNSIFFQREVRTYRKIRWGTLSLVVAERALIHAALADTLNAWFLLLSESCV
jgi:hypothetical protein